MINGHFENCLTPKDCWCETRLYSLVFGLGIVILAVQIAGSLISGSLALLADSGHVAVDNLALALTLLTAYLVKKYRHMENTIRMIGGYINAILLLGISIWVFAEAFTRWQKPVVIDSVALVVFAFVGGMGNWFQHKMVSKAEHTKHTVTSKSARLHILSDFWQSVAVVVGGIIIYATGWTRIDSLLSLVIAGFMLRWAIQIFLWSKKVGEHFHRHHLH